MSKFLSRVSFCLCLMFFGCEAPPKVDDVYEHKITKERISILNVGMGKELYDALEEGNRSVIEDFPTSTPDFKLRLLNVPIISDEDRSKYCVSYYEQRAISPNEGKLWKYQGIEYENVDSIQYQIIFSVEKLNKDYVKISEGQ